MKASLTWIPMQIARSRRIGPPDGLEDFQQGWFWNLLWASLEAEFQGYLPMSSNLWTIAGARRSDFWESHKSRLLACFEVREMVDGKKFLFYPPLVNLIQEQLSKLQGKQRRTPDEGVKFSEDSTGIHKRYGGFSSSLFGFEVDSKTTKEELCTEIPESLQIRNELERADGIARAKAAGFKFREDGSCYRPKLAG